MKRPEPITDLKDLPVLMTIKELAGLYRISERTIRDGLQRGTFRPLPWDKYPYRWAKKDVELDLLRRRSEQRMRKHGFAQRRLRPAKAGQRSAPPAASGE